MNVVNVLNRLQRDRRAFTLVELLVVIAIISILATMTLFTLYGVREDAKERRARAQVARIHELIMQQWESYRTRAVPVQVTYGTDPRTAAQLRLNALRELMRMELPDRKTDLLSPASDYPSNATDKPRFLRSRPTLWRAYVRRARQQVIGHYGLNASDVDAWKDDLRWTPLHQHAECLYMILATMRDGDTTGLDSFTEEEIGDADNDGMPEILDPWGVPFYFLRWAPGFRSSIQLGDIEAADGNAGTGNGDAFDPLKVDPRFTDSVPDNDPFLLFPLIVSAGRDRTFDLLVDFLPLPFPTPLTKVLDYNDPSSVSSAEYGFFNDPYFTADHPTLGVVQIGTPADANGDGLNGYADNITSHLIEVR